MAGAMGGIGARVLDGVGGQWLGAGSLGRLGLAVCLRCASGLYGWVWWLLEGGILCGGLLPLAALGVFCRLHALERVALAGCVLLVGAAAGVPLVELEASAAVVGQLEEELGGHEDAEVGAAHVQRGECEKVLGDVLVLPSLDVEIDVPLALAGIDLLEILGLRFDLEVGLADSCVYRLLDLGA